MDYQYMNTNQISNLDYWSLVNMLMIQITPDVRKQILDQLTEMNNQLLIGMKPQIQSDLARSSIHSSRKKDVSEIQHPSLDRINPLPLNNIPISSNNQFAMNNSYQMPQMIMPINNYSNSNQYNTQQQNDSECEIDIDDIIDEIHNTPDELDEKLARIKNLHAKIISDKRRRRKERDNK